jgi:hypothetical protein
MVMMMMEVEMLVFWVVIPCSPSSFFDRKGGDSSLYFSILSSISIMGSEDFYYIG